MKLFKLAIYFFIILTTFSACRKDDLVIDEKEQDTVIIKYEVETSGVVTDRLGSPIEDVKVTLGTSFTTTDQNGYFKLTGLANAKKGIFKIEKQGYFTGYPVFYPEEGVGQYIRVELMDRVAIGSVNSNSKVVSLNQHQIDFSNATFKDVNGTPYDGEVTVYTTYLDPTDEHLNYFMSGDLVGINTENEEQILTSYGMLNVELEDEMGNMLNIEGEAELTMEVPSSILNNAPATIPLWYFDEDSGNWIEEGEATLIGNQYVGKVTHFTLWNCDDPRNLVTINGSINTTLNDQSFIIKITDSSGSSKSTTVNESLRFSGKVPANENLTLEILDQCGTVLLTQAIGPFSSDTSLGGFDIASSSVSTLTISGTIVDCNLNSVSNGYVIVSDGNTNNHIIDADSNGSFNSTLVWCNMSSVTVVSYDSDNAKISEALNLNYMETLSTGDLITCDDLLAGIHISGPVVNKYIPFSSNFTATNPPAQAYEVVGIDDQGNGNKILYTSTIVDWGGPNSTLAATTDWTIVGTPAEYVSWQSIGSPDLATQINNPTPGGVIDIRFIDVDVEILDGNSQNIATHPGHTIRYTILFD